MIEILLQTLKFAIPPVANYLFRVLGLGYKNNKSIIISSIVFFIYFVPLQILTIYWATSLINMLQRCILQ